MHPNSAAPGNANFSSVGPAKAQGSHPIGWFPSRAPSRANHCGRSHAQLWTWRGRSSPPHAQTLSGEDRVPQSWCSSPCQKKGVDPSQATKMSLSDPVVEVFTPPLSVGETEAQKDCLKQNKQTKTKTKGPCIYGERADPCIYFTTRIEFLALCRLCPEPGTRGNPGSSPRTDPWGSVSSDRSHKPCPLCSLHLPHKPQRTVPQRLAWAPVVVGAHPSPPGLPPPSLSPARAPQVRITHSPK